MPILKIKQVSKNAAILIWKVDESLDELLNLKDRLGLKDQTNATHPIKKLEFLGSRIGLYFLFDHLGLTYQGLFKDEHNKPFPNNYDSHISISHAYPYVGVYYNKSKNIGLDLEIPKQKHVVLQKKYLSDSEQAIVNNDFRLCAKLWSAKEAIYKLNGRKGLSLREGIQVKPPFSGEVLKAYYMSNENLKTSVLLEFELIEHAFLCFTR